MLRHSWLWLCIPALACAQVGQPTASERGGPATGGGTFADPNAAAVVGNPDPRDLTGSWRIRMSGRPGSAPALTAAVAPASEDPDAIALPAGFAPQDSDEARFTSAARRRCLPSFSVFGGIEGPLLVMQSPEQITLLGEEMHHIRRIYLRGAHTPGLAPSYLGESIGHWEGDVLVVDTTGIKDGGARGNRARSTHLVERFRKIDNGAALEDRLTWLAADGSTVARSREVVDYRPGQQPMEWICEDFSDNFLDPVYEQ
ncbi:MAG: hypothetical protein QM718_14340 [Steroidobacteraceae bacterium]